MFKNRLKRIMADGQPGLGTWILMPDPYVVGLVSQLGFDWLVIDTEHVPVGPDALRAMLNAANSGSVTTVVRLPKNDTVYFKLALDLGAHGIMVPMVNTADDARMAVRESRYAPLGQRGFAPIAASLYFTELKEYLARANDEVLLIAQIETKEALENLEAILAVDGIDAGFIASGDLSQSMGLLGQTSHPDVTAAIEDGVARARQVGKPCGTLTFSVEDYQHYAKLGASPLTLGTDMMFLTVEAKRQIEAARSIVS